MLFSRRWNITLCIVSGFASLCWSFTPTISSGRTRRLSPNNIQGDWKILAIEPASSLLSLNAAGSSGKKRKRRRREDEGTESSPDTRISSPEIVDKVPPTNEVAIEELLQVAKFEFESDKTVSVGEAAPGVIPLPDIKETLKKKEEEERARIEEEKLKEKRRIKRSDKEAFKKLLEQQPYADADDSYFEIEEYTVVSALLGEGSKPFLGIPMGPLQAGHFVGSLGIMLMAFVVYPGFPLTNLPTPLRECLQQSLAITYAINLVLAVFAAFKAGERDQPKLLWVIKTFFLGGLCYDQLTQLPLKGAKPSKSGKARK